MTKNIRFRTNVNAAPERTGANAESTVSDVAEAIAVTFLVWPAAVMESPTMSVDVKRVPTPVTVVPELDSVPVPDCDGELSAGEKGESTVRLVLFAIAVMNLVWPFETMASPTL